MERRLARNMMGVGGLRTVDELNGISCQGLELIKSPLKNKTSAFFGALATQYTLLVV
jgi:hypothetical protein